MTQTILYIQAQLLCVVLLASLFLFLNHYEVGKQKRIKWIYILSVFAVVTDLLCVAFVQVCASAHVLYAALVGCIGYLWFVHCVRRRHRVLVQKVWFHIFAILPTIAMCICTFAVSKTCGLSIGFIYVVLLWTFMGFFGARAELKRHKKECLISAVLALPATLGGLIKLFWLPQGLSLFGYGVLIALAVLFARTLYRATRTDKLTKLSNREGMDDELREQLAQYKHDKNDLFYVIACDMDRFKQINDVYGHDIGNEALCLVSEVLLSAAEENEAEAFRIGGDEFLIIVDTDDEDEVRRICEQLRMGFENAKRKQSEPYKLCMSVGYELFDGESDIQALLKRADTKLYNAKKNRE